MKVKPTKPLRKFHEPLYLSFYNRHMGLPASKAELLRLASRLPFDSASYFEIWKRKRSNWPTGRWVTRPMTFDELAKYCAAAAQYFIRINNTEIVKYKNKIEQIRKQTRLFLSEMEGQQHPELMEALTR